MLTTSPYPCSPEIRQLRRTTLNAEFNGVLDAEVLDLPYRQLIGAERYAASLAMLVTDVPGLLKDEGYANAQLADSPYDTWRQEGFEHVRSMRQRFVDARMADPQDALRITAVIPHDVMDTVIGVDPSYADPQAARLLLAIEQGWNLRMVDGSTLRKALCNKNTSLLATLRPGIPGKMVYREHNNQTPHESVHRDPASINEATLLMDAMLAKAWSLEAVARSLQTHIKQSVHPPHTSLFDLRRRRI